MNSPYLLELEKHDEINEVMRRRPSGLAHGTLLVLGILILASIVWLMCSHANLVVLAAGRVRPLHETHPVVSGERFAATTGGRIVDVCFVQGQRIEKGDTMIRFDTTWLDHEIESSEQAVASGLAELQRLDLLEERIAAQHISKVAEFNTLVIQAESQLTEKRQRRELEIELAKVEFTNAESVRERLDRLSQHHAASEEELQNATAAMELAAAKLMLAELPVDASKVEVLRKQAAFMVRQYDVQCQEFIVERESKAEKVDQAEYELESLRLEREQACIAAPVTGVVVTSAPNVGDVVPAGEVVAEIAGDEPLRLDVAIAADEVGHIRVGMPARIKLRAFDYQEYGTLDGRVDFVSPDSQVPDLNSTAGDLPVFRARIKLDGETVSRGDRVGRVTIGMAADAEICTERRPLMWILLNRIDRMIRID